jgi:hypothetical protein
VPADSPARKAIAYQFEATRGRAENTRFQNALFTIDPRGFTAELTDSNFKREPPRHVITMMREITKCSQRAVHHCPAFARCWMMADRFKRTQTATNNAIFWLSFDEKEEKNP